VLPVFLIDCETGSIDIKHVGFPDERPFFWCGARESEEEEGKEGEKSRTEVPCEDGGRVVISSATLDRGDVDVVLCHFVGDERLSVHELPLVNLARATSWEYRVCLVDIPGD